MENVKGMLSAKVDGVGMIERIMDDLRSAGGKPDNYHILPLVADTRGKCPGTLCAPRISAFRRLGTGLSCWAFGLMSSTSAACKMERFQRWRHGP
jgi:hypothetical protein